jgi:hypothetical protein
MGPVLANLRCAGAQPSFTHSKALHRGPGPWKIQNLQIAQFAATSASTSPALARIAGFFHRHPFRDTP